MKTYFDKTLAFAAKALSEESGQPSSRRVAWVAAIFAAIFFAAGLLGPKPELAVDLIKFVITAGGSVFAITSTVSTIKGPPPA